MPVGKRPQPPAETKIQLIGEITALLQERYRNDPRTAIEFALNYYTSIDLVGIRKDLEKMR